MGIFDTYEKKPKRNGFPLSYNWFGSLQDFGVLYPIMAKPAVPGDVFKHAHAVNLQFMPMSANVNHRFRVCTYYFFVPNRILWDKWDEFISRNPNQPQPIHPYIVKEDLVKKYAVMGDHNDYGGLCHGSLADYLGHATIGRNSAGYDYAWTYTDGRIIDSLPFRAYQKIWVEYFADEQNLNVMDHQTFIDGIFPAAGDELSGSFLSNLGELNQLCCLRSKAWNKDPFTSSLVYTTSGNYQPTLSGTITIEDIRNANTLTKFFERMNRSGQRPQEFMHATFGVKPKDYRLDMPEFLGASSSDIVFGQVMNSEASIPNGLDSQAQGYSVSTARSSSIAGHFKYKCREFGWYIGLLCIVPEAVYFKGTPKYLEGKIVNTDYPFPDFATLGDEAIKYKQLKWIVPQTATDDQDNENVFAYAPRYWEYKYYPNELHGLFRDNAYHDYTAARRMGSYTPMRQLGFAYIQGSSDGQILDPLEAGDQDELKNIFNINTGAPIAYVNIFHQVKGLRPFPYSSVPRL